MKTKTISLPLLALFLVNFAAGQNNSTEPKTSSGKHAVHFELLGWAVTYSINYEYRFLLDEKQKITLGGGISAADERFLTGISANYLYGRNHMVEVGITPYGVSGNDGLNTALRLGYRYESQRGFLGRIGITPIYFSETEIFDFPVFLPWAHVSVGWVFGSKK